MTHLNGTWRHGNALIVFGPDTVLLGHRCFSWIEDGERLYILPAEAEIVVPYRCEGDTLVMDVDGVVSMWDRVVEDV